MEKTESKNLNPKKSTYFPGTGRRKSAIANVRIIHGKGKILINKEEKELDNYVLDPLIITGQLGNFDISVNISGGGFSSQKDAIRLGLARSLVKFNEEFRSTLRKSGYLTRDPREKERKKPGLKRARKAPQWQKR